MITLENRKIGPEFKIFAGSVGDACFRKCTFDNARVYSMSDDPAERLRISNVEIHQCKASESAFVCKCVVSEVVVDGLLTRGPLFLFGNVFEHVTLRGRIGRICERPLTTGYFEREPFGLADEKFYANVDWALDISKVESIGLEVLTVPGDKVRRDPETQVLLTRDKVQASREIWSRREMFGLARVELEFFLKFASESAMIVANRRAKTFSVELRELGLLRQYGIAEAD